MPERTARLAETLRERLLWGLHGGTILPGDRFASVREIAARFQVDARTALRACRVLEAEGLLVTRRRSGMYVALTGPARPVAGERAQCIVEILADALERGIAPAELASRITNAFLRRRLRVLCVCNHPSQLEPLSAMATRDYGVEAIGVTRDELESGSAASLLESAEVAITTVFNLNFVRRLFEGSNRPVFTAAAVPAIHHMVTDPAVDVYVIIVGRAWSDRAESALEDSPLGNVRFRVIGEDDLDAIPANAHVFASPAAVALLEHLPIGRRAQALRYALAPTEARGLINAIVAAHLV